MLDDITEYQTVSIPHTMMIDGGVMPRRSDSESAGVYGKSCIRGEDMCFLNEHVNRMRYLIADRS